VIHVVGTGLFATATVDSKPKLRKRWPGKSNRYAAALNNFELIEPAISLATIQRHMPTFGWPKSPQTHTTPSSEHAAELYNLIRRRRETGLPDLDDESLAAASLGELRAVALMQTGKRAPRKLRENVERVRSVAVQRYVLIRADGFCEGCSEPAPFHRKDGTPYLETHHVIPVADDGPDDLFHVIALCPNCHRRVEFSKDAVKFNSRLIKILKKLEPK
jgi:hypothetical protein